MMTHRHFPLQPCPGCGNDAFPFSAFRATTFFPGPMFDHRLPTFFGKTLFGTILFIIHHPQPNSSGDADPFATVRTHAENPCGQQRIDFSPGDLMKENILDEKTPTELTFEQQMDLDRKNRIMFRAVMSCFKPTKYPGMFEPERESRDIEIAPLGMDVTPFGGMTLPDSRTVKPFDAPGAAESEEMKKCREAVLLELVAKNREAGTPNVIIKRILFLSDERFAECLEKLEADRDRT
jgi:hypothetical protein